MKTGKIGDYLLWKGEPAKIIAQTHHKTLVIELIEDEKCPHCSGVLGKKQIHVVESSPYFNDEAQSVPTIKDSHDDEN